MDEFFNSDVSTSDATSQNNDNSLLTKEETEELNLSQEEVNELFDTDFDTENSVEKDATSAIK